MTVVMVTLVVEVLVKIKILKAVMVVMAKGLGWWWR